MDNFSVLYGENVTLPEPFHLHLYFERLLQNTVENSFQGVIFEDQTLSYWSLNKKANIIARAIGLKIREFYKDKWSKLSSNDYRVVAIDIEPSLELIIVLLAIIKLGLGYLPVDSQSAINRVKCILQEAKPLCIVTQSKSAFIRETNTVWSNYYILDINDFIPLTLSMEINNNNLLVEERLSDGRLLAVIYTSGSTGRPKGVRLCHRTAFNRLYWHWKTFPCDKLTVGCFKTSLMFIDSIVEIFSCVLSLVPLLIVSRKIVNNPSAFVGLLEENTVTRLTLVPSILRNILLYLNVSDGSSRLSRLTLWMSNSETLPILLLEKFFNIFPNDKVFVNLYGSTETMADVTYEVFRAPSDIHFKSCGENLSIGKPMFNNRIYIVDEDCSLLRRGIGEICVSGMNVAAGYVNDMNDKSFRINPFIDETDHQIFYRTGDYGQIKDNRLIYEGRRDSQVKVRGQRVNISEIEKAIQGCQNVEKVYVMCTKLSDISMVIVGYFTAIDKCPKQKMYASITDCCRKSLPSYMVPKLIQVDEIPLQAHTGKVDQVALRKMYEKMYNRQSTLELSFMSEKELKALRIIALNLSLPSKAIPLQKSFFDLGGNSVSMIATIVQLSEHGLSISIEAFSQAESIKQITDMVVDHTRPLIETLKSDKYIIKGLSEVCNCLDVINMIADSFVEKEPLDILLGITKSEFLPFATSLYKEAYKEDLSFLILKADTGDIVGGDFLFDFSQTVCVEHHDSMAPIVGLFHHFQPIMDELRKVSNRRFMLNFCLGVHKDLPHTEQVEVCHLIESNVLQMAKEKKFSGVITNNTNPATQDICEHFFGYKLLSEYLVRDFSFNGRYVFAHAPEDYRIKLMIRYLDECSNDGTGNVSVE